MLSVSVCGWVGWITTLGLSFKLFSLIGEGYGTSETGLITSDNVILPDVEVRLRDVPELGYSVNDKPYPRGEILARTTTMIREYLCNPELNRSNFTYDGFFCTGDVGELVEEEEEEPAKKPKKKTKPEITRRLFVIDRVKNMFKLQQGEFVHPAKLEAIYQSGCSLIQQIFVYGESSKSGLIAVVVPSALPAVKRDEEEEDTTGEEPEKGKEKRLEDEDEHHKEVVRTRILKELDEVAHAHKLRLHEHILDIHVDTSRMNGDYGWTSGNGFLTPSMKIARTKLSKHYRTILAGLYEGLENRGGNAMLERWLKGKTGNGDLGLGTAPDSLSAVRLSLGLNERFNVHIPAQWLVGGEVTTSSLASFIGSGSGAAVATPPAAGASLRELVRSDLRWTPQHLRGGRAHEVNERADRGILVTGVTGFIGCHLL